MCILFIAKNQHPDYPLILCANRDEFHQRPTERMHWWSKNNLLAGKDLQAGGTWLGVDKQKQIAALTNFRRVGFDKPEAKSRGELVLNALNQPMSELEDQLKHHHQDYNGFNLLYGNIHQLSVFNSVENKVQPITDGFHSICNGALDDIWPKMQSGINKLEQHISENKTLNIDALFEMMLDETKAELSELPDTGVGQCWEVFLSSIFIRSKDYGTRSTCIITVDNSNQINIYEQSYNADGESTPRQHFDIA